MKSFSFATTITLGCLVLGALPLACGDDTTTTPTNKPSGNGGEGGDEYGRGGEGNATAAEGGAGGAGTALPPGISDMSKTVECSMSCSSAKVGLGANVYYLDPCCGGASEDECGLNTAFLATAGVKFAEACQPKGQEGPLDDGCQAPPAAMIPMGTTMIPLDPFKACCRAATGTCGVLVDKVSLSGLPLGTLGLGCVDAAPFGLPNKACGAGSGGAGSGGSGAGGESSGAGAPGGAGAPASGGAGGAG